MELLVAAAQAVYYVLTGVWPLVSMKTFLKVTGPKTDLWLVRTIGLFITVRRILLSPARDSRSLPAGCAG